MPFEIASVISEVTEIRKQDDVFKLGLILCSCFVQVFILGFGNIGIDLAKRLRPFGVKIIATKRSWTSHLNGSSRSNGQYLSIARQGIRSQVVQLMLCFILYRSK